MNLVDLPYEILFIILKKLDNINVLYSLPEEVPGVARKNSVIIIMFLVVLNSTLNPACEIILPEVFRCKSQKNISCFYFDHFIFPPQPQTQWFSIF